MGWLFSSSWQSKEDVLNHFKYMCEDSGYNVNMKGNWLLAKKNEKVVDLIYIKTECDRTEGKKAWGYKDISIGAGPFAYNAPLEFVKEIYPIFKYHDIFKEWLNHYPGRKEVYRYANETAQGSFEFDSVKPERKQKRDSFEMSR
jgi:hypothetical protein